MFEFLTYASTFLAGGFVFLGGYFITEAHHINKDTVDSRLKELSKDPNLNIRL